ncbi:hypothetical protein PVAP13_8KG112409 [Panicum virgatum]|uniref:Uncharacterized protein n=1 Tax=Panicum virgatum TaxID=38727 RepID=A0A8T0PMI1_PANVG|nr:hypothetical protein PVAP13_8KG112409 [Panicum virgatum]
MELRRRAKLVWRRQLASSEWRRSGCRADQWLRASAVQRTGGRRSRAAVARQTESAGGRDGEEHRQPRRRGRLESGGLERQQCGRPRRQVAGWGRSAWGRTMRRWAGRVAEQSRPAGEARVSGASGWWRIEAGGEQQERRGGGRREGEEDEWCLTDGSH